LPSRHFRGLQLLGTASAAKACLRYIVFRGPLSVAFGWSRCHRSCPLCWCRFGKSAEAWGFPSWIGQLPWISCVESFAGSRSGLQDKLCSVNVATTRRHHPNPAEAQGRWRGRGASRSGSGHHACSVRATSRAQNDARRGIIFFAATEVRILPARHVEQPRERKVRPGEGLFSLRLLKFESYQPGMLNNRLPFCVNLRARNTRRNPCRSCTLVTPQLEREPSLLRHFGQSGGNSPATPADFDPNGFRSSSPTSRSHRCAETASLVSLSPPASKRVFRKGTMRWVGGPTLSRA
jgi:hypothetical protein